MHSWRRMVQLLEMVDRPQTLGFQADMAHTLLFTLGYNAPEDRLLPEPFDWSRSGRTRKRLANVNRARSVPGQSISTSPRTMPRSKARARMTRPDAIACPTTLTASSTSSATRATGCETRTASPLAPSSTSAGTAACFPTSVMMDPQTWRDILAAMIAVRDAHGWD